MSSLVVLILVILAILTCIIFTLSFLAEQYRINIREKRLAAINEQSPYRAKPKPFKSDKDHLSKDRIQEKKIQEELENSVSKYNPRGIKLDSVEQQIEIVGVAKPVGFWSRFVMNQKIGFIVARAGLQSDSKKGYWENLIKAQAASQSKDQGKGR